MVISILGIVIGIGAILLGNLLEGGHISSLIQPTAALIVGGGTVGALGKPLLTATVVGPLLGETVKDPEGAMRGDRAKMEGECMPRRAN